MNDVAPTREVKYEVTRGWTTLLERLGCTLLVSTYQAGKLVAIRGASGQLGLSFHNFDQAMGIVAGPDEIVIGGRGVVWTLKSAPTIAAQIQTEQKHDGCFLARSAHVCQDIHLHEVAFGRAGLWVVNTMFSCLCTLDSEYSFVPRWRPNFVSELVAEDRCHLNGLAMSKGRPAFVTVMGQTDTPKGWRADKVNGGCVIDVQSNAKVCGGLSMPHSPRIHQGRLFALDSGRGRLGIVEGNGASAHLSTVSQLPGFTRGLALVGPYAFVGMSRIRESKTFGGVPIGENPEQLKCAVAVVDLRTGKKIEHMEFVSGVEEVFDVQILHGVTNPFIGGVHSHVDASPVVWSVPPAGTEPPLVEHEAVARGIGHGCQTDAMSSDGPTEDLLGFPTGVHFNPVSPLSLQHFADGLEMLKQGRYESSLTEFDQAIRGAPKMVDAWCNMGVALQFLGRLEESEAKLRHAIELQPNSATARLNLAMTLLLDQQFAEGWDEYEHRWKTPSFGNQPAGIIAMATSWQGQSLAGKSILVYGEQGIGDEVMFHSCMPDLITKAGQVLISCEPRLVPILRRSFPEAIVFEADRMGKPDWRKQVGQIDFQTAVGSLPRWFRRDLDSFPRPESYLSVDPLLAEYWRNTTASDRPAIGISWRGGVAQDRELRSTELRTWEPLLKSIDANWISLQYGDHCDELRETAQRSGVQVQHFQRLDPLSDLDDFMAMLLSLDLVISVDNSTVHFAGALGVPTIAMLAYPSKSHWRWGCPGQETDWYRSVELLRKQPGGSWSATISEAMNRIPKITS